MSPVPLASFVLENSAAGNVPLMLCLLAGAMYWIGGARFRAACRRGAIDARRQGLERRRTFYLLSALVVLVLALQQPIDGLADKYFWAHMCQHVLLLVVVPPLMLLAAPWMRLWRGFPLGFRRPVARWVIGSPSAGPLRAIARALGNPWVAFTAMSLDLIGWHIPAAYDLTLRNVSVHYTEHATFLFFGLVAWGQVIDSPPFHSRLDAPRRVAFSVGQMAVGWVLAMLLAFASNPWYSFYADVRRRDGGISALTDQHLAAGVMWVPASLPWSLLIFVLLYRWLAEGENADRPPPQTVRVADRGGPPEGPVPHEGYPGAGWPAVVGGEPQAVGVAGEGDQALSSERRIYV
jgi:putative membrane protein